MSIKDYPARLTTGYYRVRETGTMRQASWAPSGSWPMPSPRRMPIPAILYFPMKGKQSTRSRSPGLRKLQRFLRKVPVKRSRRMILQRTRRMRRKKAQISSRAGILPRRPRKQRIRRLLQMPQQTMRRRLLKSRGPEPRLMRRKMRASRKLWNMSMTAMTRLSPTRS